MPSDTARSIRLSWSAITDVGRVREHNEDAFVARDLERGASFEATGEQVLVEVGRRGVLLAVSDGMGGAAAGEVASALVLQSLQESLAASHAPNDDALREAVENANRVVFEAAQDPSKRGMGATLTAVLIHGRYAYIASVGDSRAYLQRGARFRRMTRDQSYVQVLVDAGVLDAGEAENSPMKNIVLQSMGQKSDVQVALGRLEVFRGDRLLICSDGLTGHLKDPEIATEIARRDQSLDVIARTLIDSALARGGEDNVTVVVAELSGEGLERAEMPESVTQTFQVLQEFEPGVGGDSRENGSSRRSGPPEPPSQPPAANPLLGGAPAKTPSVRPPALIENPAGNASLPPPPRPSAPPASMRPAAPKGQGFPAVTWLIVGLAAIAGILAILRYSL